MYSHQNRCAFEQPGCLVVHCRFSPAHQEILYHLNSFNNTNGFWSVQRSPVEKSVDKMTGIECARNVCCGICIFCIRVWHLHASHMFNFQRIVFEFFIQTNCACDFFQFIFQLSFIFMYIFIRNINVLTSKCLQKIFRLNSNRYTVHLKINSYKMK